MVQQRNAVGVEEDIIRCLLPTCLGKFRLKGKDLRSNILDAIGMFVFSHACVIVLD